jgi:hypothetical protein
MKNNPPKVLRIQKGKNTHLGIIFIIVFIIFWLAGYIFLGFWILSEVELDCEKTTGLVLINLLLISGWNDFYYELNTIIEFDTHTNTIRIMKPRMFGCFSKKPNVIFQCSVTEIILAHHQSDHIFGWECSYTFGLLCIEKNEALLKHKV